MSVTYRFGRLWIVVVLLLTVFVVAPLPASGAEPLNLVPALATSTAANGLLIDNPLHVNPARLHTLEQKGIGIHVLHAGSLNERLQVYTYLEPDSGIGAGSLRYFEATGADERLRSIVYSFAKPISAQSAYGMNVRYGLHSDGSESSSFWSVDVGLEGQLVRSVGLGLLLKNALTWGEMLHDHVPPKGGAAEIRIAPVRGLTLTGGLESADMTTDLDRYYHVGIEYNTSQLWVGMGQSIHTESFERTLDGGVSLRISNLIVDWRLKEIEDEVQHMFGVSYRF